MLLSQHKFSQVFGLLPHKITCIYVHVNFKDLVMYITCVTKLGQHHSSTVHATCTLIERCVLCGFWSQDVLYMFGLSIKNH